MNVGKQNKIKYFFISLVFVSFLFACKNERKEIEEMPPMSQQAVEMFTITETEYGKLRMILESESALIDEEKQKAHLKLPRVKFYQNGLYSSTLVTESADVDLKTYDVVCHGKCTVDTANGEELDTTNLRYDSKKELIFSKDDVKIKRPNEVVYGKGFEADTKLEKIIIKNQKIIIN